MEKITFRYLTNSFGQLLNGFRCGNLFALSASSIATVSHFSIQFAIFLLSDTTCLQLAARNVILTGFHSWFN